MSLFDAFVRDFFGADPFIMARPAPPPPRPQPMQVHRVTQMVEGLISQNVHYAGGHTRTFRHVTYSSGSKSLNNISSNAGNGEKQSLKQSSKQPPKPQSAASKQPLAITYADKAPKPSNPKTP